MRFGQLFQKALTETVTMEVYKMQTRKTEKPTGKLHWNLCCGRTGSEIGVEKQCI